MTERRTQCAVLLLVVAWAGPLRAETRIGYEGDFLAEIRATFFQVESGSARDPEARVRLDAAKLGAYRALVERKLGFVREHVRRYERLERGRSEKAARKRVRSRDTVIALEDVLHRLDAMQAEAARTPPDVARLHDLAAEALMVEYATRAYTDPIGSLKIPVHLWNMVFDWSWPAAPHARRADREAGNLLDPATGAFYTPDELAALMRQGQDLSLLDPPARSPFWHETADIASLDVVGHYLGGEIPVLEGEAAVFPPADGADLQLDKTHLTQSKPKLDVYWLDEACRARPEREQRECRRSYKLKFGMEMHADPVANALLASFGYNADLAAHLRKVRVYLGDVSFERLEKEWTAYFDLQRVHTFIPLSSVMSGRGRDERGEYVDFPATVAEYKPRSIERIGFWAFDRGMGSTAREARGLALFNVWIANADMKDEENNKLSLRPDAQAPPTAPMRMYLTQQDLGHAFGVILPERPEAFPWEALESSPWSRAFGFVRGRTELNYMNLQQAGLEWRTTYSDAKWMARRIAQLRREQIEAAVALGRWPGGIGALYVEKLVNRRNQIVRYYGLESQYGQLPVDRHLTTPDGSVVDGHLVQGEFPAETTIHYDRAVRDVVVPALSYVYDGLKAAFQEGIGAIDEVDPGTWEVEGRLRVAPEMVVKVARRVYENPAPRAREDQFIVEDTLRIGFRVGVGRIAFAEGGWMATLALAYPVPTRRAGVNAQGRLLPLLAWKDVRDATLPAHAVLVRETAWRVGARARSAPGIALTGGIDASHGYVRSERTVLDLRGEAPLFYRDEPRYQDSQARAYVHLWLLNLPFVKLDRRAGRLGSGGGEGWVLDPERIAGDPRYARLVRSGKIDAAALEALARSGPHRLSIDFEQRLGWAGLIVGGQEAIDRRQDVVLRRPGGEVARRDVRIERRRDRRWQFVDNGERKLTRATGVLDGERGGRPALRIDWEIDDLNTHSDELDRYYAFLAALGGSRDFVAPGFRAADWEVSGGRYGRWTRMKTRASLHLHAAALDALCAVDDASLFARLSETLGVDRARIARYRRAISRGPFAQRRRARQRLVGRDRHALLRAESTLAGLRRACAQPQARDRLTGLVRALGRATLDGDAAFDPVVLVALLDATDVGALAASGDLLLEGRIYKAFENEHNLPERRDVVGRVGRKRARIVPRDYGLFPSDPVEQWTRLDWLRELSAGGAKTSRPERAR